MNSPIEQFNSVKDKMTAKSIAYLLTSNKKIDIDNASNMYDLQKKKIGMREKFNEIYK